MENLPNEVVSEILTWVCSMLLSDLNSTNSQGQPLFASRLTKFTDLNLVCHRFTHILKKVRLDGMPIHLKIADLQKTRFMCLLQAGNVIMPQRIGGPNPDRPQAAISIPACLAWCGAVWRNHHYYEELLEFVLRQPLTTSDELLFKFLCLAPVQLKKEVQKCIPRPEGAEHEYISELTEGVSYHWRRLEFTPGPLRFKKTFKANGAGTGNEWIGTSVVLFADHNQREDGVFARYNLETEDERTFRSNNDDRYWLWVERRSRPGGRVRYLLIDYEERRWYTERYFWLTECDLERYFFEFEEDIEPEELET